ncbi:MAG: CBS domain-containing protein, partial [Acidimicrobiales bacterium]
MADAASTGRVSTVADIMTLDVLTIPPSTSVADACAAMLGRAGGKVGSAIVTDNGKPTGIFTERDLVRATAAGADLAKSPVSEWMTENPDTVPPDMDTYKAYIALHEHGYRHFPVAQDGNLVGIISMRDMLRVAFVQPVKHPSLVEAPKGLEGVVVAETEVGDVRGQEGFYHYRQYNAVELAEKRSLEDVWFLLYNRHLPSRGERADFMAEIQELRTIPASVQ